MAIKPYETASLGVARLQVTDTELVDGEIKETQKTFYLVIDFNTLALALKETGLDFAAPSSWDGLLPAQVLQLCWCSMQRFHAGTTLEEVGRMLAPAERWKVRDMLLELAFPGSLEAMAQANEKRKSEAAAQGGQPGESEPVAGSVAS